ncbi:MAG: GH92 family glycosyl hydrolase [Bacteroidales bacterium]|nr:GH92 family glycosyl hydrolase [Bacteroidales bacterium]
MKTRLLLLAFLLLPLSVYAKRPSDWVNPGIGTAHSRWFFYTPAAVPFGMAKPAPSTNGHEGNASGWQAVGYDARHSSIEGFACFHEFQIGGVMLMPTVGELKTVPGELDDVQGGYRSNFDKADEHARPGYYSVVLKDYGIKAELTATKRVAFQRFTFPKSGQSHIIFDIGNKLGESGRARDAHVVLTEDGRIEGWVTTYPVYVRNYQPDADLTMYFSAVLDKIPSSVGTFHHGDVVPGFTSSEGVGAGMYLDFDTNAGETVTVKIGLSYTSVENARLNLDTEARNLTFDRARKNAERIWDKYLGRIKVGGGTPSDMTKFYTGLFHALLGRGLASDVNGAYPRNDGSVGQIPTDPKGRPKFNHYNTDAIWGGFWNLTQLWALAYPEYYADWVSSQLLVYQDSGWLGDGIACSKYVSGVGTNFVSLAIASAYNCGIRNFDVELGYEAALKNEIEFENRPEGAGKLDVGLFVKYGYSPYTPGLRTDNTREGSRFSASHTMEYSFSTYAVAQFAKALGKEDDYSRLMRLSNGWKNLFDPETKLIRPKWADGRFLEDFDPSAPWVGFQEGNAIQYTYYVPHDIETLVSMVGADEFNNRLDKSFEISRENIFGGGKVIDAFSGLQAVYNHGNQPNLHISWLFNYSGKPWLTQKWVRAICDEFYGDEPVHGYGYGQDEDQGQLGAWYVMSSIGLFDVKGLTAPDPEFCIGSPLFKKVSVKLNRNYYKGRRFTILASADDIKKDIYIKDASLNGKSNKDFMVPFSEVVKGGKLRISLSDDFK